MLKSTYRPAAADAASPLPPNWTEHKAPTGHLYYYNAETKQSTYTRPKLPSDEPLQIDFGATEPDQVMRASMQAMEQFNQNIAAHPQSAPGHFTGGRSYQDHSRRRGNQGDRPKSKAPIPDCAPWVLVKTKLGRRFVHNTETKQSLWKFPQDVMMAVIEMDRLDWEAKKKAASEQEQEVGQSPAEKSTSRGDNADRPDASAADRPQPSMGPEDYDSDSYEEVEVTDDEAEDDGDGPSKRPRLSDDNEDRPPSGPVEFDEDDIAWQLAQMEAEENDSDDFDTDYQNEGNRDDGRDEDEGLPLTDQDNLVLFRSLLDDSGISPYSTFDKLIEDTAVVEDPRYVALPTTSARRDAFSLWSKHRISELQQLKASQSQSQNQKNKLLDDPRVRYLQFLHKNATPKLYWPEFKRKFKKSAEMTDRGFQDKDREKLYRDLVAKLKLPESDRRKELVGLLKDSAKKSEEDRGLFKTAAAASGGEPRVDDLSLPESVLKDVKFYILDPGRRDELVRTFLQTL